MRADFDALKRGWDAVLEVDEVAEEVSDATREMTPAAIAQRELERGFPFAVKRLISIAMHGDDRIARLAANDVINHNFTMAEARREGSKEDNLAHLIDSVSADDMSAIRAQVEASKALGDG